MIIHAFESSEKPMYFQLHEYCWVIT